MLPNFFPVNFRRSIFQLSKMISCSGLLVESLWIEFQFGSCDKLAAIFQVTDCFKFLIKFVAALSLSSSLL